jgi:opacity protein-like surface antigen
MDVEIGPPGMTTNAKVSFSDYVEFIDIGAALAFEARGERWSTGGNFLWVKLIDNIAPPNTTLELEIEQFLLELFVGYQPSGWEDLRIIGGMRYMDIDTDINFVNQSNVTIGDDFTDPYVGFLWTPRRGKWEHLLEADVGGGIDADFAWSFTVGTGYHFGERMALTAAYRFIDIDYQGEEFIFDGTLDGLQIGLLVKF